MLARAHGTRSVHGGRTAHRAASIRAMSRLVFAGWCRIRPFQPWYARRSDARARCGGAPALTGERSDFPVDRTVEPLARRMRSVSEVPGE